MGSTTAHSQSEAASVRQDGVSAGTTGSSSALWAPLWRNAASVTRRSQWLAASQPVVGALLVGALNVEHTNAASGARLRSRVGCRQAVSAPRLWQRCTRRHRAGLGHFLPEEQPEAAAKELLTFFGEAVACDDHWHNCGASLAGRSRRPCCEAGHEFVVRNIPTMRNQSPGLRRIPPPTSAAARVVAQGMTDPNDPNIT